MGGPAIHILELAGDLQIVGGPFTRCPDWAFGVNMAAAEIEGGDIRVPVVDFGVPDPEVLKTRALYACFVALKGDPVYVGCGFGIGRTGTFLMVMARITNPECDDHPGGAKAWLRERYRPDTVETAKQEALVNGLDLTRERRLFQHWLEARALGCPIAYPTLLPW